MSRGNAAERIEAIAARELEEVRGKHPQVWNFGRGARFAGRPIESCAFVNRAGEDAWRGGWEEADAETREQA